MRTPFPYVPSFAVTLLVLVATTSFSQDSLRISKYRLRVGDLNLGLDTRYLNTLDSTGNKFNSTYTEGLSFRYQSSIVFNYAKSQSEKRFRVGDLLSGEVSAGFMQSNDPSQKIPLWFAYRFEVGMVMMYKISQHSDVGLNLVFLRFSRDFVTQNISGSALELRWRIQRVVLETGLENRGLRIVGYVTNANDEKNMFHLGGRYLLSADKNIGFRFEWLNRARSLNGDGICHLRVFWGKYF